MKKFITVFLVALMLLLTIVLVASCKSSKNDTPPISSGNSTDVEVDVNDIFGSSNSSGSSEEGESSVPVSSGSTSTGSSGGGTSNSTGTSASGSSSSEIDYEDPNVWTPPVKIPAKTS